MVFATYSNIAVVSQTTMRSYFPLMQVLNQCETYKSGVICNGYSPFQVFIWGLNQHLLQVDTRVLVFSSIGSKL